MAEQPVQPQWRRTYDAVERELAPKLEELVRSDQFIAAVRLLTHSNRRIRRSVDDATRDVLHAWNRPTRSDVVRVLREVGAVHRRLDELEARLGRTEQHGG